MSYTLPSGLQVELIEPTFGDELHAVSIGADDMEEMVYAKLAISAPSLSREAIAALSRADGHALIEEVGRIWEGRPVEQEAPFGSKSNGASVATQSKIRKSPRG